MDFFEAQDAARQATRRFVVVFSLAVLALVTTINGLALAITAAMDYRAINSTTLSAAFSWPLVAMVSAATLLLVGAGSLYKMNQLSSGGKVVAEMLGGRLIPQGTDDPDLQRLLNVVAEMAIAAGTPVPPVYLMKNEPGINAFAAGYSPHDAVIGITRGAVLELNREQLQGVIGHEFSHILNGDMRLNIRLMGAIHGILLIGLIGGIMLRSSLYRSYGYRRRSSSGASAGIMAIGLGLTVLGYLGTFFGNLVKAAVSRQREFLADASAVQFTRNRNGIAGALRRIGGIPAKATIASPAAAECSHAFFGEITPSRFTSLFATHPPLDERIRRLDPAWDGTFDTRPAKSMPAPREMVPGETHMAMAMANDTLVAAAVAQGPRTIPGQDMVARTGHPTPAHLEVARQILAAIPQPLRDNAANPFGARAIIYALAMHQNPQIRQDQQNHLNQHADPQVAPLTEHIYPLIADIELRLRLPLIELTLPTLSTLSTTQHDTLTGNLSALIAADGNLSLLEWSFGRLIMAHLADDRATPGSHTDHSQHTPIHKAKTACAVLLSGAAYADGDRGEKAQADFDAGLRFLQLPGITLVAPEQMGAKALDGALNQLIHLNPLHKRRLLRALVACINADGEVTAAEAEMVRAIAATLDCPMPPPLP
jgi:Zn-dependent protease with chaperone function/uncharacterized tellurite resistance protein B-like protein